MAPPEFTVHYYEVLGVSRSATDADIRKAYRKLARSKHPDKNGNTPAATAEFQKIQQAYDTLNDPQQRRRFDFEYFEIGLGRGGATGFGQTNFGSGTASGGPSFAPPGGTPNQGPPPFTPGFADFADESSDDPGGYRGAGSTAGYPGSSGPTGFASYTYGDTGSSGQYGGYGGYGSSTGYPRYANLHWYCGFSACRGHSDSGAGCQRRSCYPPTSAYSGFSPPPRFTRSPERNRRARSPSPTRSRRDSRDRESAHSSSRSSRHGSRRESGSRPPSPPSSSRPPRSFTGSFSARPERSSRSRPPMSDRGRPSDRSHRRRSPSRHRHSSTRSRSSRRSSPSRHSTHSRHRSPSRHGGSSRHRSPSRGPTSFGQGSSSAYASPSGRGSYPRVPSPSRRDTNATHSSGYSGRSTAFEEVDRLKREISDLEQRIEIARRDSVTKSRHLRDLETEASDLRLDCGSQEIRHLAGAYFKRGAYRESAAEEARLLRLNQHLEDIESRVQMARDELMQAARAYEDLNSEMDKLERQETLAVARAMSEVL